MIINEGGGEIQLKYEWVIQKTIEWIESHLHEQISANDIDEVTGFSKYHFHRIDLQEAHFFRGGRNEVLFSLQNIRFVVYFE